MADGDPVVLELAPLPREQIGPFFLLSIDKDADRTRVESAWARAVLRARKKQSSIALEEINWARDTLGDADRRIAADAAALNPDTAAGDLRRLRERWADAADEVPAWRPVVPPLPPDPPPPLPDLDALRRAVPVPDLPLELPAVGRLLDELARSPLDPWDITLPPTPPDASA